MGLDIWSYDRDLSSCFSKRYYEENIKPIFEIDNPKLEAIKEIEYKDIMVNPDQLYPDHYCNNQYLRSSYNNYGYDTVARHYGCILFEEILHPMVFSIEEYGYIKKEAIFASQELAALNNHKWCNLNYIQDLVYRYDVLEYKNPNPDEIFTKIITSSYIVYNSFTKELIDQCIKNMKKPSMRKYVNRYENYADLIGIGKIDGNIIGLFKDDITYYRQISEIIIDFINSIKLMDDPVIQYWG